MRGFRSEKGMSSSEMSLSRASLAADSAAEFPLMPTWPVIKEVAHEYNTIHYNATQCNTVKYNAIQYNAIFFFAWLLTIEHI